VSKVVPMVVKYLRESLANEIFQASSIKSCKDITVDESRFSTVRNALKDYVRIISGEKSSVFKKVFKTVISKAPEPPSISPVIKAELLDV